MPRAEFATFGTERSSKPMVAPSSAAIEAAPAAVRRSSLPDLQLPLNAFLRVLLVEENPQIADRISDLLHDVLGDRYARDWVEDPSRATEIMVSNRHDLYLVADGRPAEVAEGAIGACDGPVIVYAARPTDHADVEAISAGAADYIPLDELTPERLERNMRHALLRQQAIMRTRREIESLTNERIRLNILRDANHRFVENACHDFRSPLTVIKEFAAIIAEGLAGDVNEEQAEFLQIILTRVDNLSQMVDGILDSSRLESDLIGVRREEQPVAKLIEHARATLEQRASAHNTKIEFTIPEGLPNVFADLESIGRVIVNLGTNACKYAGEGGKVEIWARYDAESRNVAIGVTDHGPGIAPEHVKLIFDRFQQLPKDKSDKKDGFGLGLHIASELVRVNFGTLAVESEPQKGSTFWFTLPLFDVDLIIPLYFNFLRTARQAFQKVSLALATSAGTADPAVSAQIERTLHRQLRSYDLLLRLRPGGWLICAAGDQDELTKITERILGTYAEMSRNRPEGRLPEMRFRPIGDWTLANRPEGLAEAIRGVAGPGSEARAAMHVASAGGR